MFYITPNKTNTTINTCTNFFNKCKHISKTFDINIIFFILTLEINKFLSYNIYYRWKYYEALIQNSMNMNYMMRLKTTDNEMQ